MAFSQETKTTTTAARGPVERVPGIKKGAQTIPGVCVSGEMKQQNIEMQGAGCERPAGADHIRTRRCVCVLPSRCSHPIR